MLKRYLVFGNCGSKGGYDDFIDSFNSLTEALKLLKQTKNLYDWTQLIDSSYPASKINPERTEKVSCVIGQPLSKLSFSEDKKTVYLDFGSLESWHSENPINETLDKGTYRITVNNITKFTYHNLDNFIGNNLDSVYINYDNELFLNFGKFKITLTGEVKLTFQYQTIKVN
jgi:hypothetical protein